MRLEDRTTETDTLCPLDGTNLKHFIRTFDNGDFWDYYICPTCEAIYNNTNPECLKQKSKEHLDLLTQLQESYMQKAGEIRKIINKILEYQGLI